MYLIKEKCFKERSFETKCKIVGKFDDYSKAHEEIKRLVLAELIELNNDKSINIENIDRYGLDFRAQIDRQYHTAVMWKFDYGSCPEDDIYYPIKFYDIEEVNMKYKIELTCWDYGNPEPYKDEDDVTFNDEKDAKIALLERAIEEARYLNEPDPDNPDKRYFAIDLEGGDDFDVVIRCWDGPEDYMNVTGYKIICIEEEL